MLASVRWPWQHQARLGLKPFRASQGLPHGPTSRTNLEGGRAFRNCPARLGAQPLERTLKNEGVKKPFARCLRWWLKVVVANIALGPV
ncbi:hypothetical protein FisN_20Hu243 [Fistulifera solaris]|uniref:Uncharacterized protein n=1 Tax=Fistulifera solaris TaxID=1519565 RepID=A0A1Z5JPX5_FISSO|nr:hypothetical protein FisN_20Hu243 [Fistulifera solaris]|eukprot:GAX16080.1 hypothetical protein FisN_20Hu243 [Fistulifera solaris]